jgi:hypothetical protein
LEHSADSTAPIPLLRRARSHRADAV